MENKELKEYTYEWLLRYRNDDKLNLVQECLNTIHSIQRIELVTEKMRDKLVNLVYHRPYVKCLVDDFNLINLYDPKKEIAGSLNYKLGLERLIKKLHEKVSFNIKINRRENIGSRAHNNSLQSYKQGYDAGNDGEHLLIVPKYDVDYYDLNEETINKQEKSFYIYELVTGYLLAHHLPKLEAELKQLNNDSNEVIMPNQNNTKKQFEIVKDLKPIKLSMDQRQIIYLFQSLIKDNLLHENLNPTLWDLVAKYFTDKNGEPLKNIHQNKDGLKNTKTGKPKYNADKIETIVNNLKQPE